MTSDKLSKPSLYPFAMLEFKFSISIASPQLFVFQERSLVNNVDPLEISPEGQAFSEVDRPSPALRPNET